ncbi:ubiquitin-like autophagy protein Apg12-domain-containing protein [Lipomyces oligophaga]|uniref:ubiquitin-like autophagy protein Apg12-domain-containing protein n=1 Tax=Lipomyces oligophaga TaxID=45792 RepID=UPI0034CE62D9
MESNTQPQSIPEESQTEQRVTLAASVILSNLPRDAAAALDKYANPPVQKVSIRFRPIGSAPILTKPVARISGTQRFEAVVRFLRRQLRLADSDPLFLYINSSFAPSLDQEVGSLHDCFKVDGYLHINYCTTAAFG